MSGPPAGSFRCSAAARERGDDLAGTASFVRGFLLMEEPGPWGVEAWRDARLPEGLGAEVIGRAEHAGLRPLLIRRAEPVRGRSLPRRVFACAVSRRGAQVFAGMVSDPREILDLDLVALARGEGAGLDPWPDPVFAVCVHGKHDACCAERGRPVLKAVAAAHPDLTWGVSHLGGDRFAANLLVLPDGLYYGGLDDGSGPAVTGRYLTGRLDLDHLRGRTFWGMPVQAAEIAVRRALADDSLAPYQLTGRSEAGGVRTFTFATPGGEVSVQARRRESDRVSLTCSATRLNPNVSWECTILDAPVDVPRG